MSKKKRRLTEKEILFKEEAARKREERAEAKRLKRVKDARWLLAFACIVIAVSLGFVVWTAARMYRFETDYVIVNGTVTDYEMHKPVGKVGNRYTLVISYTFNQREYKLFDTVSYRERPTDMLGTTAEIYVNPKNPENAKKVATADDPSFVSAIIFPFGAAIYALAGLLLLQEKSGTFVKRVLRIWLPIFLWCAACVLLFGVGLPNDGFGAVFLRVEGASGYAVIGGIALLAVVIDGIISVKKHADCK